MSERPICEAFSELAQLCIVRGLAPIPKDRITEVKIDDIWTAKVNASGEEREGVLPYHALIEWRGWVSGMISPYGGTLVAHPNANEDKLVEALRNAQTKEPDHAV